MKPPLAQFDVRSFKPKYFQEAGLAIGGEDFNPYVMLEVHYNNEKKESGKPNVYKADIQQISEVSRNL